MRKLLQFLSLLDHSKNISLTSVAVWIVLVKLAVTNNISITEASAFLIAMLNYGHKRLVESKRPKELPIDVQTIVQAQKDVEELKNKVSKLTLAAGWKNLKE